jgi:hypothetical protein
VAGAPVAIRVSSRGWSADGGFTEMVTFLVDAFCL